MATLEKAISIAALAHAGQVDKAGQPYIFHPIKVMLRLKGQSEQIVAVLHDVVEDTEISIERLAMEGFTNEIIEAINCLTKLPNETRLQAARRAKTNQIAKLVKLADNAENMDLSRISNPSPKDYERLEEYKLVRALLLEQA
jgi:(p)ppGpp synthase/HD superfamily hydrolase